MKETKNLKILGMVFVGLIVLLVGSYFFNKDNSVEIAQDNTSDILDQIKIDNFGDMAIFIKDDLTDVEVEELKNILEKKDGKIAKAEEKMKEAFESEDEFLEEAFGELENTLNEIKGDILPFVKESKIKELNEYFRNLGASIEAEYIRK